MVLYANGQQDSAKEGGKKVITYAPMYGANLTEELYMTLINRFEAAHPDIEVELILQPAAGVMHRDFLKTLQATAQFPDVMSMASPMDFVNSGLLMSLPADEMGYMKDMSTQIIGGKNYVAVYKSMVGGFWYNKDLFKRLNLEVPTTWDEFLEVCEAIKADGQMDPISVGVKDGWPQLVLASMIISADIVANDAEWGIKRNRDEVHFSDPDFKRCIKKYVEIVQKYANDSPQSVTYEQMRQQYYVGKCAMLPMGSWCVGEMATLDLDFEPGFFPVPSDDGNGTVSLWLNEGLSVSAKTKHPEACLEFIKFFMTDPVWYSMFLKTEALFSNSNEDITFDMSPLRKEVGQLRPTFRGIEHWYDLTGDAALLPGLQAYFNKMTAQIITAETDAQIEEELRLYDEEWNLANSNLQ